MGIIKTVILLIGMLLASQAASTSWVVSETDGRFYLNSQENSDEFEIISAGGRPKFISGREIPGGLRLLRYRAGTAGTSAPVQIERALVIHSESGRLIGDYPFRYQPLPNGKATPDIEQPQWCLDKRHLRIVDNSTQVDARIPLPQESTSTRCLDDNQQQRQQAAKSSGDQRDLPVNRLPVPGSIHPLYDGLHSWRYDAADGSQSLSILSGDQQVVASADISNCHFCTGVEDNCLVNGVFPLPSAEPTNGVSLGAICNRGAHGQALTTLSPAQAKEPQITTLTGRYQIDIATTNAGVIVSGDRQDGSMRTRQFPETSMHDKRGKGYQLMRFPSPPEHPPEVTELVDKLKAVVRTRDAEKLQALLDPEVIFSFAERGSVTGFSEHWSLGENPEKSEIWEHLDKLFRLPPAYLAPDREIVFPYFAADWPEGMDPADYQVVITAEAMLHAGPSPFAPLTGRLPVGSAIKIVNSPIARSESHWLYAETHEGDFGYLPRHHARSVLDFRLGVAKTDDDWRITFLIAGD